MSELEQLLFQFVAAIGLGGLESLIVQVVKRLGWLPDGWGGTLVFALNLAIVLALVIAGAFGFDYEGETGQEILNMLALGAELIASFLSSIGFFTASRRAELPGYRSKFISAKRGGMRTA